MNDSYYHILGIPTDADSREIKRAYHRLARELHPDKAPDAATAKEVEQRFAVVSKAYNALKDPSARAEYDKKLNGSTNGASASKPQTPTAAVLQSEKKPSANGTGSEGEKRTGNPDGGITPQRAAIAQKAYGKGLKLSKEKDFGKAVEFFEAAISNNPAEANYYSHLAMALINAKRSASKAIEAAQHAIELDTYNLDYKFTLAQIYDTIGSKSNAVRVYEEIIRWDENNKMAQQLLRTLTRKASIFDRLADSSPIIAGLRAKFAK